MWAVLVGLVLSYFWVRGHEFGRWALFVVLFGGVFVLMMDQRPESVRDLWLLLLGVVCWLIASVPVYLWRLRATRSLKRVRCRRLAGGKQISLALRDESLLRR